MSTTIRLTPHGEALLQKQLANGSYRSPEEVVERALETLAENSEQSRVSASTMTPAEAVADIQANRKGVTLGGLKIRDLIHEGHKY
jgi:Arc/MetJ-type ribon-helix-helix transcriptional regulator